MLSYLLRYFKRGPYKIRVYLGKAIQFPSRVYGGKLDRDEHWFVF